MYSVYKITNCINGKIYIGSSIRPDVRWKQHKYASKNINNNKHLYQAMRKYGVNNFIFEIIADNFNSKEEMENYEEYLINILNTTNPKIGYNNSKFSGKHLCIDNTLQHIDKIKKQCAKVDIYNNIIEKYESYAEASKKNNNVGATRIRRVCKGKDGSCYGEYYRDINENGEIVKLPFVAPKCRKMLYALNINDMSEQYFSSISEASKLLNINRQSIIKCIQGHSRYKSVNNYIFREVDLYGNILANNISIDEYIQYYNLYHPIINGKRYAIKDLSYKFNIKEATIRYRLKHGYTIEEALKMGGD